VFGRQELEKLRTQKQALLLESALNRHALQAEWQELRSAAAWMSDAARAPSRFVPLLAVLAPLAGFLVVRSLRRPESLFTRLVSAAKWIGPIYSLWRGYSAARKKGTEAVAPAD
jgi:hypothetical protein